MSEIINSSNDGATNVDNVVVDPDTGVKFNSTEEISKLINIVDECMWKCENQLLHVEGIQKLSRRLSAEKRYLTSLLHRDRFQVTINIIKSSNAVYLKSLVDVLFTVEGVKSVLQAFKDEYGNRFVCDIVCDCGRTWMKVIARNAQALHLIFFGQGDGKRSVCSAAHEYLKCAANNPVNFVFPQIVFYFANGVTSPVASYLTNLGIQILGDIVDVNEETKRLIVTEQNSDDSNGSEDTDESDEENLLIRTSDDEVDASRVNLDVSTLVCLVSELTHGGHVYEFMESSLEVPAALERATRLMPILESYLQGKTMVVCRSALSEFCDIVHTVGGEKERERAENLIKKLEVIEDDPSERAMRLVDSAKIKPRSKVIFGTGDKHKLVTMTANIGFVRAAQHQNVNLAVYIHGSRALTEQKQKFAKRIL